MKASIKNIVLPDAPAPTRAACAYSETSQKAEGKREEAEETTAEKAEEERRVLDAGE